MRYATLDENNVITGLFSQPQEFDTVEVPYYAQIGWTWSNETLTPAPDEIPEAKLLQVKIWLVRNGYDLDSIPPIIEAVTQPGPLRDEALLRWQDSTNVPYGHPLMLLVAAAMQPPIDLETAWPEILAIGNDMPIPN